jgi:LuxR family maltose regulon positive regulatory protein
MASLERAGHVSDAIGCAISLADIEIAQGRLGEAMRTYERGLQLATEHGAPVLRGAADMHVGMSELFRERDELEAASGHLLTSRELGDENGLPQNPYRSRVAAARIRQAEGDLDGALELLTEAERLYVGDYSPNVRPIAALKARLWIAQGKLSEALGWAREHGLSAADDLTYVREFEHISLAAVLLAQGVHDGADHTIAEAADLTDRLLAAAEDGGRHGVAIEILVVQALARHARGDLAGAMASLNRAVVLAEAGGYVRVFIDAGPRMAMLLKLAAKRRNPPVTCADSWPPLSRPTGQRQSHSRCSNRSANGSSRSFGSWEAISAGRRSLASCWSP